MGCERRQTLHVFQAGVQITAGDHGAVERLQQLGSDADQFIFDSSGFRCPRHDLAAGEAGAIEIMLVGHQASETLSISNAGFVAGVIQQSQSTVGRAPGVGVLRHHEDGEMVRDVLGQHGDRRSGSGCSWHQATFSIIWWCST